MDAGTTEAVAGDAKSGTVGSTMQSLFHKENSSCIALFGSADHFVVKCKM